MNASNYSGSTFRTVLYRSPMHDPHHDPRSPHTDIRIESLGQSLQREAVFGMEITTYVADPPVPQPRHAPPACPPTSRHSRHAYKADEIMTTQRPKENYTALWQVCSGAAATHDILWRPDSGRLARGLEGSRYCDTGLGVFREVTRSSGQVRL